MENEKMDFNITLINGALKMLIPILFGSFDEVI